MIGGVNKTLEKDRKRDVITSINLYPDSIQDGDNLNSRYVYER